MADRDRGTFNQGGGTLDLNDSNTNLILGNSGGAGTYNLTGGTLNAGYVLVNSNSSLNASGGASFLLPNYLDVEGGGVTVSGAGTIFNNTSGSVTNDAGGAITNESGAG